MINIVHNIDNMKWMETLPDKYFNLVIDDPPYGRDAGNMSNGTGGGIYYKERKYKKSDYDKEPLQYEKYKEICRVSIHQMFFGVNYYDFAIPAGRIIWDKMNDGSDQGNCEILSNPFDNRVIIFRYKWRGFIQGKITDKRKNEQKIHGQQKPIVLYKYLLRNYAQPGWKIGDFHVGSGSSRIACYDMGFDFEGCELDKDYWQAQEERFKNHITNKEIFSKDEIQDLIFQKDLLSE